MHSNSTLDSAANLLVHHMVFMKSPIASHHKGLDMLSRSSSHKGMWIYVHSKYKKDKTMISSPGSSASGHFPAGELIVPRQGLTIFHSTLP